MKRIWICIAVAALLLASCGSAGNVADSSSDNVSASLPESASDESQVSEAESSQSEQSSSPAESSETTEQASDSDVLFTLEEGTCIDRMYRTPEGNFAAEVARGDEVVLMLLSSEGDLLKEKPVTGRTLLREPDGFSLMETGEYYTFDLEECTADEAGVTPEGYSFDYSEDGKYFQLTYPDGSVENVCETGAESYDDIESHRIQIGRYAVGPYLCYSRFDGNGGCYDIQSGKWSDYTVTGGFAPRYLMDGILTGYGQGGEGGYYPSDTALSRFDPETGELESLPLPLDVWPTTEFGDGQYYMFTVGFYNSDGALDTRLTEQFPGLAGFETEDASLLLVYDAMQLAPVGYIYHPERTEYFQALTDGSSCYVWDTESTETGSRAVVRQFPLTPPDQQPDVG